MKASNDTGFRSSTWGLLAAALLPILLACGESKVVTPSSETPTAPVPTFTESIYLADAGGTVQGRVTQGSWPSWSPDSRRIVFHRDGRVRVISADGSGEIELAIGEWPTWSPDGGRIAFVTREGGISVMNADGSSARTLMSPALLATHPWGIGKLSWSPDGALIAFEHLGDFDGYDSNWILVMTVDGATQHSLANYGAYETDPSWSPDGSRVVYGSYYGISVVARGGGEPTRLYRDVRVGTFARPTWSPDGRRIAFNTQERVPAIVSVSIQGSDEGSLTIGPDVRVLIQNGIHAAWSPDGQRIAFVRLDEK